MFERTWALSGRAQDKDEIAAQDLEKAALAKVSVALNDGKAARGVALNDEERRVAPPCLDSRLASDHFWSRLIHSAS